jgi:hypothetical protein
VKLKKVYLAGAMEFALDGGTGWRADLRVWLHERLGHQALDPTILEHDQLTDAERLTIPTLKRERDFDSIRRLANRIVHYDAALVLQQADYVICHWNEATQRGCGTAGELTLAAVARKPVHLLLDYPADQVSTWLVGCTTTIHHDWEELKSNLLTIYGPRP